MPSPARIPDHRANAMSDGLAYQETEITARHAHFLREHAYPGRHKRKRIASEWGVSESLARTWLEGAMPASRHLVKMIARWGTSYIAFVWEPAGRWARELATLDRLNRVAAEADAIKRDIEELKRG